MIKKIFATLFVIFLLGSIGYLGLKIVHTIQQKKQTELNRSSIPDFILQTLSGEIFTKQDVPMDKFSLIIYFSPDCDHCHYEASIIRDSLHRLSSINILWVSQASKKRLELFGEEYGLNGHSNIFILRDEKNELKRQMGITISPAILIYNRKQELVTLFKGETKFETILKYLKENQD